MVTLALIVLSLVHLAASCQGKCCWSDTFEVQFGMVSAMSGKETTLTSAYGKYSLDTKIQMTNSQMRVLSNGKSYDVRIIEDYKTKKQYEINERTQKCVIGLLKKPWLGTCLPDKMRKVGTEYIGAQSNKYTLDVYEGRFGDITYAAAVTEHGCIPVIVSAEGTLPNAARVQLNIFYSDFTEGIRNSSVFAIPKSCHPKSQLDESWLKYPQYSSIVEAFMPNVFE